MRVECEGVRGAGCVRGRGMIGRLELHTPLANGTPVHNIHIHTALLIYMVNRF